MRDIIIHSSWTHGGSIGKHMAACLLTLAWICGSAAFADVYRCRGSFKWGPGTIDVRLDVVPSDELDRMVTITTPRGVVTDVLVGSPVGVGRLEIVESFESVSQPAHKYKFIVTQLPDKSNSLVGVAVRGPILLVLRADLWKPERPFRLYRTDWDEVLTGTCE